MLQKTIKNKITFSDFGLHNGKESILILFPAKENFGIRINDILINPFNVTNTFGMTCIGKYSMIEHLMSSLYALNIDNINIKLIKSNELPILDGCNRIITDKILETGIVDLPYEKQKTIIKNEIQVKINDSYIRYIPTNNNYLEFECIVDFPYIGKQQFNWNSNNFNEYYNHISNATTFFWDDQLKNVQENGLAKGVNNKNTLILNKDNFKLFNNSDFARHKLLDLIGDIATLNIRFFGKLVAYKPGHTINNKFIRKIQNQIYNNKYEIPFFKIPQNQNINILQKKINDILINQNYIDNNVIINLEEKIKNYLNVRNVIAVNSGTSAILVALMSLELNQEDYVIVPKLTFWATYQAPKLLGKKVILIDVDKDYQLDIKLLKQLISKVKIKVVLTVHLYGIVSNNYVELVKLCKENNIILMEDSSQAFGSKINDNFVITNSYISCVSMYPTKIYGSCGNSGFIVTSDDSLAYKMKSYRDNGRINTRYDHFYIGGNFVLDTINATYNIHKIEYINEIITNTSFKFQVYLNELKELKLFQIPKLNNQTPNGFNFILKSIIPWKRDKLIIQLKNKGISTSIIYPKTIDKQNGYVPNEYDIIVDNDICSNIFSLPIYYDLSINQQRYIVKYIKKFDVVNIVIIGCGNMGMKHYNNLINNENFNVAGYIDVVDKNLETKKLENIGSDSTVDMAIISTITKNHFEVAINCLKYNVNILIEKPAFLNIQSYNIINNLIKAKKIKIGISMIERYNPCINLININQLKTINITRICNYSNNFDPNNILLDLFIHDIDILNYFHRINLSEIKIISVSRLLDIYHIKTKYNNIIINFTIGNSDRKSIRNHQFIFINNTKKNQDFDNKYNKLNDLHNDFINYLTNKPNMISTLHESLELFKFIKKIENINKLENKL